MKKSLKLWQFKTTVKAKKYFFKCTKVKLKLLESVASLTYKVFID